MSLSNTVVSVTYQGNGSVLTFPIPFEYFVNSQVKVKEIDTLGAETIDTEGTEYTIVGSDVVFGAAPSSQTQIKVYRETPRTQDIDYIENGPFKAEDHEHGMDRMVMMIQELGQLISEVALSTAGGAYVVLPDQVVAGGDTISGGANQRMLKHVQGPTGGGTADLTTPIGAGTVDGQELRLVGSSDADPLTIKNQGNVSLNGDVSLEKNSVLDLFWDLTDLQWIETGRSS